MFKNFNEHYRADNSENKDRLNESLLTFSGCDESALLKDFFEIYSGQSFNGGRYRVHSAKNIDTWNNNIVSAFPEYRNNIFCFGYDWLGRQFALDRARNKSGYSEILMFDIGFAEVLQIPENIIGFHNEELVDYSDAALASSFFDQWNKINDSKLKNSECVGYKVPPFLSGSDDVTNLEKVEMDVYWHIMGGLLRGR